jgi:hypothetical protein
LVETKDQSGEGVVDFARHSAVVACFIVEFSAPLRGSAVVDSGGYSCSGEGAGAEYAFIGDVVGFVTNNRSDPARNDASCTSWDVCVTSILQQESGRP